MLSNRAFDSVYVPIPFTIFNIDVPLSDAGTNVELVQANTGWLHGPRPSSSNGAVDTMSLR